MEPERIIVENEVMWETRDRFRGELIDQLRGGLEGAAHKVGGGSEDGVTVVTDRGWRAVLNRIEGQRLPPIDHHYAEVLTGAIVTVWAKCPRCGIANSIAMSVDPVLTIDTHTAELKLKAKAKPRSHVCGQLTLMETGAQATLEVEIESLVGRVYDLVSGVLVEGYPSVETIRGWDRATIDQVLAWAEAEEAHTLNIDEPIVVPPLPRVLGGEADPEAVEEDVLDETGEDLVVDADVDASPDAPTETPDPPAAKRARRARLADRVIPAEPPDDITCNGSVHVPGCDHFDEPDADGAS